MMFTIRAQQQVLTWSYVLAWTSLGPEHKIYIKKKKNLKFFFGLVFR